MAPFQFVGGALALDFTNTVGNRLDDETSRDYFVTPADAAAWIERAKLGEGETVSPAALARLKEFRELLYRVFSALATERRPSAADLERLDAVVHQARSHQHLAMTPEAFVWRPEPLPAWKRALFEVALSAEQLLVSGDYRQVRRCEDDRCGWLFVDRSRGVRRRWCSMADCGNRAKARRHYAKRTPSGAQ
jgi:predicted RNA-binding Zn ribbon-like protein